MEHKEFESILNDIEKKKKNTSYLSRPQVKDLFKTFVKKAGNIALVIEKDDVPDITDQEFLHSSGGIALRLYQMGNDTLGNMLEYSGYSKTQANELTSACAETLDKLEQSSLLVFRGAQNNMPLLHTATVRHQIHGLDSTQKLSDSPERAFINYLKQEGLPHLMLESMARLSLYQEHNFTEDLSRNNKLKSIYDNFLATGELSKTKIVEAAKYMEDGILSRMNVHPIVIRRDTRGYDVAVKDDDIERINIKTLYDKAPSRHLDAYTIQDKTLYVSSVTTMTSMEANQLSTLHLAKAFRHGLDTGLLKDIDQYEVRGYCNSDVHTSKETNAALNHLLEKGLITAVQQRALTMLPVHQEILKLLDNTATEEYTKYSQHIRVGLYGDNTEPLKPKERDTQVVDSIEQLSMAAHVLQKICEVNPGLHNMQITAANMAIKMAAVYTMARSLTMGHPQHETLTSKLDHVEQVILEMNQRLTKLGQRYHTDVKATSESAASVRSRRETLASTYSELQTALRDGTSTQAADLLSQKAYSTINSETHAAQVGQILAGTYTAKITKGMLRDALLFRANQLETMLQTGTRKKANLVSFKHGLGSLLKLDTKMTKSVYEHIAVYTPRLVDDLARLDGSVKTSIDAQLKNGVAEAIKKLQKNKSFAVSSEDLSI